jgi:hypothetical protein
MQDYSGCRLGFGVFEAVEFDREGMDFPEGNFSI